MIIRSRKIVGSPSPARRGDAAATRAEHYGHPATILCAVADFVGKIRPPGGTLLDPFCGLGTMLAAALVCMEPGRIFRQSSAEESAVALKVTQFSATMDEPMLGGGSPMTEGSRMSDTAVTELGQSLMRGVREIDRQCNRKLNGVEYGLCNVKLQFREDVEEGLHPDAPTTRARRHRKLSWEPATAWMLHKGLPHELAIGAKWEEPYPSTDTGKKWCDLVVKLNCGVDVWVEVKFAWKSWFDCIGGFKTNSEFFFADYLLGLHHSHSAAGDLKKLLGAPKSAYLGMLLIGFDSIDDPMDRHVAFKTLERQAAVGWSPEPYPPWYDRRDPTRCRINCWWWWHAPR
jgi:hypothetical protein